MSVPRSNRGRKTSDPPYVYADTSIVTSRAGKESQLHVVRCPYEPGVAHQHRAALDFDLGRRKAPCGQGSYYIVSGVLGTLPDVA